MKLKYIYILGLLCLVGLGDALAKSNSSAVSCRCPNGLELFGGTTAASKSYGCVYSKNNREPNLWTSVRNVVGNNGQMTRVYRVHYFDQTGNVVTYTRTFNNLPPVLALSADCGATKTLVDLGETMTNYAKIASGDEFVCGQKVTGQNVNASTASCVGCTNNTRRVLRATQFVGSGLENVIKTVGAVLVVTAGVVKLVKTGGLAAPAVAIMWKKGTIVTTAVSATAGVALGNLVSTMAGWGLEACNTDIQRKTSFYTSTDKPIVAGIQPNPASTLSMLNLRLPEVNDLTIEIFDQQGRHQKTVVMGQRFAKGMNQIPLDVQGLTAGTYIVKITGNQGLSLTHRLVKK
ncbi:T9SS type A sorting domain-containing protein [uncultured Microscilla sp.]|uniref:T9SS type A sorting domain-containing protein n=1 Tax=uncultured Microscilla sp. TaxID=432653 RepID=UPI00263154C6|nr:T9SS type A sorting domain-containing protein [uncultured Microscilla sp.]